MINKQNQPEATFTISGNWSKQSKNLMEKYTNLTHSDLMYVPGKENELIARLEKRLNKKREEVINIIKKSETA